MRRLSLVTLALAACTSAQQPAPQAPTATRGNLPASPQPFKVEAIGKFDAPFAMAFLPDGRLLVTEKAGKLKLFTAAAGTLEATSTDVSGVPAVAGGGQGGLLDVAVAPDFAQSHVIYLSYSQGAPNGSQLALTKATLSERPVVCVRAPCPPLAALTDVQTIWRSGSPGEGGQFGAVIAFAPDGKSLFLASGERQRFTPAQDPNQALGKIIHLTLDGKPWPGNPGAGKVGTPTVDVIDPPANTAAAATAPVRKVATDAPNTAPAATWSSGHRNPYGLAFDHDGRLWEVEMGPKGGDEVNLILPGRNYGWPRASNGDNYDGLPIPDHRPGDGFEAPKVWWNPSISPGGTMIYDGAMFPQWRGSMFVAALSAKALIRVALTGDTARTAEQWDMGARIRDVAQAPDGAIWVLADGSSGKLLRLSAK